MRARRNAGFPNDIVDALLARVLARVFGRGAPPWIVGLSGLPGSGKSTLAAQLVAAARERGIDAVSLALDDFYLGRRARAALARDVHPLLCTRGVPGTHDVALLARVLDAAAAGRAFRVPRFDKGRDSRLPPSRWPRVATAPRLIVLEGWCVGVPPQAPAALRRTCNALERREDPDARWRTWVDARLAHDYEEVWSRLGALVLLQAPSFARVRAWRGQAEDTRAPRAMDARALDRFVLHFDRLGRHALRVLPARADIVLTLDARRRVRRIRSSRGA